MDRATRAAPIWRQALQRKHRADPKFSVSVADSAANGPDRRAWQEELARTDAGHGYRGTAGIPLNEPTTGGNETIEERLLNGWHMPTGMEYLARVYRPGRKFVDHTAVSTDGRLYIETQYEYAVVHPTSVNPVKTATSKIWNAVNPRTRDNWVTRITHRDPDRRIYHQTIRYGSDVPEEIRQRIYNQPELFPEKRSMERAPRHRTRDAAD